MKTADFDYNLPRELIAQEPLWPRDHSRLMVVNKTTQTVEHRHFYDFLDYLKTGDLLVCNNSKVFRARLYGQLITPEGEVLREHGKPVEIFLVRPMENLGVWQVLAKPGRHVQNGLRLQFASDFYCDVMLKEKDGTILVQFSDNDEVVRQKANNCGEVPVPPYIKKQPVDLADYQTIYAKQEGSVAAPTAGFHFTKELIEKIRAKGVEIAEITLHVGLGTFLPVKSEEIEEHRMHSEWVELNFGTAMAINQAKSEGRRVIAVGTTTVRTLEGLAHQAGYADERLEPYQGEINLFITPGFQFKIIDALITNFHLPKSTLLMLVSAFVGNREFMLHCYQQAIKEKYRFYSFGDGMLITS